MGNVRILKLREIAEEIEKTALESKDKKILTQKTQDFKTLLEDIANFV